MILLVSIMQCLKKQIYSSNKLYKVYKKNNLVSLQKFFRYSYQNKKNCNNDSNSFNNIVSYKNCMFCIFPIPHIIATVIL